MQVVYIEVFFAENFLINYLLLKAADHIFKKQAKYYNLIFAAIIGAFYSLFVFPMGLDALGSFPFRLLFCFLMCETAFRDISPLKIIKSLLGFIFVTLFIGGSCFMIVNMAGGSIISNSGLLVTSYEFKFVLLGITAAFSCVPFIKNLMNRLNLSRELIYGLVIFNGGRKIKTNAFLDTGSNVRDIFGKQAVIIQRDVINGVCEITEDMPGVVCNTVCGEKALKYVSADKIIVLHKYKKEFKNPFLLSYDGKLSKNGEYAALIGSDYIL